jgi:hypothetical protein
MSCPLLTQPNGPFICPIYNYGGDDKLTYYEGLISPNDSYFAERDQIRQKYGEYMDQGKLEEATLVGDEYEMLKINIILKVNKQNEGITHVEKVWNYIDKLNHNKYNRIKIINALGGSEFCKNIPVIFPSVLSEHMQFKIDDIPSGHSLAQYEDFAGRKGVLMKLKNKKTAETELIWFCQRYRETSIEYSGGLWVSYGACKLEGIDQIIDFIYRICPNPHDKYDIF